jgi:hypothetical protein
MPEKINLLGVIHTGISDHSLIYGIRKINPGYHKLTQEGYVM